jgi:hypothetical protein
MPEKSRDFAADYDHAGQNDTQDYYSAVIVHWKKQDHQLPDHRNRNKTRDQVNDDGFVSLFLFKKNGIGQKTCKEAG